MQVKASHMHMQSGLLQLRRDQSLQHIPTSVVQETVSSWSILQPASEFRGELIEEDIWHLIRVSGYMG